MPNLLPSRQMLLEALPQEVTDLSSASRQTGESLVTSVSFVPVLFRLLSILTSNPSYAQPSQHP